MAQIAGRRQFLKTAILAPSIVFSATAFHSAIAMSSNDVRAIIQTARQAWLSGNGSAFADLFADDGEFIVPGDRWRGPAAILSVFQDFMSTHRVNAIKIRSLVMQSHTDSDVVHAVVEWDWEDTEIATGKISRAADAIAIDIRGDRITRWREYIDADSVSQTD